jgi:hypothetical protein
MYHDIALPKDEITALQDLETLLQESKALNKGEAIPIVAKDEGKRAVSCAVAHNTVIGFPPSINRPIDSSSTGGYHRKSTHRTASVVRKLTSPEKTLC